MHSLALLIEIVALVTPVIGIVIELRREIPDDDDRGLLQRRFAALGAAS
jgi:hypothetical protein